MLPRLVARQLASTLLLSRAARLANNSLSSVNEWSALLLKSQFDFLIFVSVTLPLDFSLRAMSSAAKQVRLVRILINRLRQLRRSPPTDADDATATWLIPRKQELTTTPTRRREADGISSNNYLSIELLACCNLFFLLPQDSERELSLGGITPHLRRLQVH